MKKILLVLCLAFTCCAVYATTETISWLVDTNTHATTTCETGGDIILPTPPTKFGYTFQGWTVHEQVEYIQSSGTQYINSGIKQYFDTDVRFVFEFKPTSSSGYMGGNGLTQAPMAQLNSDIVNQVVVDWSSQRYTYTVNGVRKTSQTWNSSFDGLDVTLFALCTSKSGGAGANASGKLYSARIYQNDVLVRDFIPVVDMNGTACLYDKITGQYFYNRGTGNFIAGQSINQ